jgi:flagellar L-ring protein precursor FlgH
MLNQLLNNDFFAPLRLCVSPLRVAFVASSLVLGSSFTEVVKAQDASLLLVPPLSPKQGPGLTLQNCSFMYRKLPPEAEQRELQLNDIITVLVDYKSALQSDGDANSKKTASFNAVLSDWLKFDGKNIMPATQNNGDPRVSGAVTSQFKTQADVKQKDALTFKIATSVVDIRPNGNLVIEGRSEVQSDDEVWEQSLTGVLRRQSIGPDRTVRSDDIAERRIRIRKKGFVHDGTNRGWLVKWYDEVKPF